MPPARRRRSIALVSSMAAALLLVAACGGPAPTPVPDPTPVPTPVAPTAGATPAGTPAGTPGEAVKLVIETATGAEDFSYATSELEAPAGSEINLQLVNKTDPADEIGHNWVLVRPGQEESVLANGITAGDDNDWLDTDDPGIIAATRLIEGNERVQVTFMAPEPGTYVFVCTFPEHYAGGMKGTLTIR